jgi:hypothetical protein
VSRVPGRAYTARRLTSQRESIRWGRERVALLALFGCLCFGTLAPAVAGADTGSIAGTVTDAPTGEPIQGAEVCAEAVNEEGTGACAYTETNGTYFIGGLDPTSYRVSFWGSGQYVFEYFDGKRDWEEADPVEVPSGGSATGVDADLDRTATINGTVRATEDGLPVEEVEVCAYPLSVAEESFIRCGYSDSDGTYSITGLAAGNYKVEFWAGFTGRRLAYQFWDHESRYKEADVVAVAEGEWLEDVDADLEPGATITGNLVNLSNGAPPEEVRVCAIDAISDTLTVCSWSNEAGDYQMSSLPAGTYKVVFSPELSEFFPDDFFPGEEDDGLSTQFWDNQPTIATANLISLGTGGTAAGINARFGTPQVSPPLATVVPKPPIRKKHKCRRGYKKKLVKGKRRCVKVRKRHRHRHRHGYHSDMTSQRFFAR